VRVVLWIGFALCVPTAASVAAPALKPPAAKAQPPIVGNWVCDGKTSGGTAEPVPDLVYECTAGGTLRVKMDGEPGLDKQYRTDTTTQPAEIDWLSPGGRVLMRGVFKVDGDRLTVCWNDADQSRRPAAVESPPKTATLLLTFKRVRLKD
jgi:uncharacterized protein (TIGR03067 family)